MRLVFSAASLQKMSNTIAQITILYLPAILAAKDLAIVTIFERYPSNEQGFHSAMIKYGHEREGVILFRCCVARAVLYDWLLISITFLELYRSKTTSPVADPGFPVGGVDLVRGYGLPRRLRFENFVSKRKNLDPWGACAGHAP